MRLRRPRIDTDEVSDRWQPRLYLRLIVLGLLVAYAIAFILLLLFLMWLLYRKRIIIKV